MDIRAENPVFVIANLIIYSVWYYSACYILSPRLRKRYVVLIWVAFYCVFSIFAPVFREDYSAARNAILIIGNILLFLFLFEGKWYAKILCFLLFVGLCLVVEIPFVALFKTDKGVLDIPTPMLILQYCVYILLNVILDTGAALFIRKRKTDTQLNLKDFLLFSLYPFSTIQFLAAMGNIMGKDTGYVGGVYLLPLTLLVALSSAALFGIIIRVLEYARLRAERDWVQSCLDSQNEYYGDLAAYYRELSRQRHDLSNHLLAVHVLISEGKTGEAARYLSEMDERFAVEPEQGGDGK